MDSNITLTQELASLEIATKIYSDPESVADASKDFGNIIHRKPAFVFRPSTEKDIASLVKLSYNLPRPFPIAARGNAHSTWGQTMSENGVVVDMSALANQGPRVRVSHDPSLGHFADVGGEQLWKNVLEATVGLGVGPTSWTDYLYLTVGGTLSCAGISGQTPFYGPQISHVLEMDVVTGKGELVTCSKEVDSELFEATLGGLGQFGIITRARLALDTSPEMVKWARLMYTDFSRFTKDQEHLTLLNNGVNYIEGSPFSSRSGPANWRSSTFFSPAEKEKIDDLIVQHGTIYCLEMGIYYDHRDDYQANENFESLIKGLEFCPGFRYVKDVTWTEFLDRIRSQGEAVEDSGEELAHPWLLLFVPGSRISDFNKGVFLDIVVNQEKEIGPVLIYPMNRNKWDEKTSAAIPDEDVFYSVSFLHSCRTDEWEEITDWGYTVCLNALFDEVYDDLNQFFLVFGVAMISSFYDVQFVVRYDLCKLVSIVDWDGFIAVAMDSQNPAFFVDLLCSFMHIRIQSFHQTFFGHAVNNLSSFFDINVPLFVDSFHEIGTQSFCYAPRHYVATG